MNGEWADQYCPWSDNQEQAMALVTLWQPPATLPGLGILLVSDAPGAGGLMISDAGPGVGYITTHD